MGSERYSTRPDGSGWKTSNAGTTGASGHFVEATSLVKAPHGPACLSKLAHTAGLSRQTAACFPLRRILCLRRFHRPMHLPAMRIDTISLLDAHMLVSDSDSSREETPVGAIP